MSHIRLLFICDILENGKGGVGDYTQILSKACIQLGAKCSILAVNDPYCKEMYEINGVSLESVNTFRLQSIHLINRYISVIQQWIQDQNPNWISLQFVPFAYHSKGLLSHHLFNLIQILPKVSRELMFHEIWVGAYIEASIKYRAWGTVQKSCINILLDNYSPDLIHTHCQIYQNLLIDLDIEALYLPLCPTIPIEHNLNVNEFYKIIKQVNPNITESTRDQYLIVGSFGSLYKDWDFQNLIYNLQIIAQKYNKCLIVCCIGNLGLYQNVYQSVKLLYPDVCFHISNPTDQTLNVIMKYIDFGLTATANIIAQKSSVVANFKALGTQVIASKCDVSFYISDYLKHQLRDSMVVSINDLYSNCMLQAPKKPTYITSLDVAQQFLIDLKGTR